MTRPSDEGRCDLCGEPMPEGESMFRMHGYSGPCPKPPMPVTTPTHCACVWHGQADGPPFSECHYHATLRAELAAANEKHMTAEARLDSVGIMLAGADKQIETLAAAAALHERNAIKAERELAAAQVQLEALAEWAESLHKLRSEYPATFSEWWWDEAFKRLDAAIAGSKT